MIEKPEWQGAGAGLVALAKLRINVDMEHFVDLSNTDNMGVTPQNLIEGIRKACIEKGVDVTISYVHLESIEQLIKDFNTPNTSIILFKDGPSFREDYTKYPTFLNLLNIHLDTEKIFVGDVSKGSLHIKFEDLKNGFKLNLPIFMIVLEK